MFLLFYMQILKKEQWKIEWETKVKRIKSLNLLSVDIFYYLPTWNVELYTFWNVYIFSNLAVTNNKYPR